MYFYFWRIPFVSCFCTRNKARKIYFVEDFYFTKIVLYTVLNGAETGLRSFTTVFYFFNLPGLYFVYLIGVFTDLCTPVTFSSGVFSEEEEFLFPAKCCVFTYWEIYNQSGFLYIYMVKFISHIFGVFIWWIYKPYFCVDLYLVNL